MRRHPHLAPSVKSAFQKIVAQEPQQPCPVGKLWALATDSKDESDVEDLGDVDELAVTGSPVA